VTQPSPGATTLRPEVAQFLARVRDHLSDLPPDERDELLEGLDADLSEQLHEGGSLPDPTAYAAELRTAAGLPVAKPARLRTARRSLGARLVAAPDDLRRGWRVVTEHNDLTRSAWVLVEALRPAWWVLRAWVAVSLVDSVTGSFEEPTVLPTLGVPLLGPIVLVAAIVVSVLIGQGTLWPGSGPDRTPLARLVLGVLNVVAVIAPFGFNFPGHQTHFVDAYEPTQRAVVVRSGEPVLRSGGDVVRNIYAYDAQGRPIQGVQLFDQQGRPVAVAPQSSMGEGAQRQVTCPWFNGTTPLFNVFPLPQREQRHNTCLGGRDPAKLGPQVFHEPPFASVPPVSPPVTSP
jgi:hypothetical protein